MKEDGEPDYAAGVYTYDPRKNVTYFRSDLTGQVLDFDGPPKLRTPPVLVANFVKAEKHDA